MKSVLKNQAFLTRHALGLFVLCSVAVCGMTVFLRVCETVCVLGGGAGGRGRGGGGCCYQCMI